MSARRPSSPRAHFSVIGWFAQCRSRTAASSSSRKALFKLFLAHRCERGMSLLDRGGAEPAVLADVDRHTVGARELALEVLSANGDVRLALGAVIGQDLVARLGVVHAEAEVVDADLHLAGGLVLDAQHGEIDLAVGQVDAVTAVVPNLLQAEHGLVPVARLARVLGGDGDMADLGFGHGSASFRNGLDERIVEELLANTHAPLSFRA